MDELAVEILSRLKPAFELMVVLAGKVKNDHREPSQKARSERQRVVPGAGVEPARPQGRGILSPLCLPIPPSGPQLFQAATTIPQVRGSRHKPHRLTVPQDKICAPFTGLPRAHDSRRKGIPMDLILAPISLSWHPKRRQRRSSFDESVELSQTAGEPRETTAEHFPDAPVAIRGLCLGFLFQGGLGTPADLSSRCGRTSARPRP